MQAPTVPDHADHANATAAACAGQGIEEAYRTSKLKHLVGASRRDFGRDAAQVLRRHPREAPGSKWNDLVAAAAHQWPSRPLDEK